MQRALGGEAIEGDAEARERGLDRGPHELDAAPGKRLGIVGTEALGRELLGDRDQIVALIAALGDVAAADPGGDRGAEQADLTAGVVDVVLALDRVAGELEDPGERIAVGGVPGAGHGDRPGRVGAHELDQGAALAAGGDASTPAGATLGDQTGGAGEPLVGEEQVDEAGPGDGDVREAVPEPPAERPGKPLGDLARVSAGERREQQRGVRREVAELGLRRPLQRRLDLRTRHNLQRGGEHGLAQRSDRIAHPGDSRALRRSAAPLADQTSCLSSSAAAAGSSAPADAARGRDEG